LFRLTRRAVLPVGLELGADGIDFIGGEGCAVVLAEDYGTCWREPVSLCFPDLSSAGWDGWRDFGCFVVPFLCGGCTGESPFCELKIARPAESRVWPVQIKDL